MRSFVIWILHQNCETSSRSVRWAGSFRLAKEMAEIGNAYKAVVLKPERKRSLGRATP
jgi:hypothetical protein